MMLFCPGPCDLSKNKNLRSGRGKKFRENERQRDREKEKKRRKERKYHQLVAFHTTTFKLESLISSSLLSSSYLQILQGMRVRWKNSFFFNLVESCADEAQKYILQSYIQSKKLLNDFFSINQILIINYIKLLV